MIANLKVNASELSWNLEEEAAMVVASSSWAQGFRLRCATLTALGSWMPDPRLTSQVSTDAWNCGSDERPHSSLTRPGTGIPPLSQPCRRRMQLPTNGQWPPTLLLYTLHALAHTLYPHNYPGQSLASPDILKQAISSSIQSNISPTGTPMLPILALS